MSFNVSSIAAAVDGKLIGELIGNKNQIIANLGSLDSAKVGDICFIRSPKAIDIATKSKASALVTTAKISAKLTGFAGAIIQCHDVDYAYALLSKLFYQERYKTPTASIHSSAIVSNSASIGKNASIGAYSVISDNAVIGDNVIIGNNCSIGDAVTIGDNCIFKSNIVIEYEVTIGNNCIVHSGTVIGSDGFGFGFDKNKLPVKKYHLGSVLIGDNVEIGTNCAIDRGAIGNTQLKNNVKLDNMVHIAHNCIFDESCCIAANAVFAGSSTLGKRVWIGGLVGIGGHIHIADDCVIHGYTAISRNTEPNKQYSSKMAAMEFSKWRNNVVSFKSLRQLVRDVAQLKKQKNK